MKNHHKITFLRSPGVQTSSKNAEKSDLSDAIDDISPNPQKHMKIEEKHSKKNPKKIKKSLRASPRNR